MTRVNCLGNTIQQQIITKIINSAEKMREKMRAYAVLLITRQSLDFMLMDSPKLKKSVRLRQETPTLAPQDVLGNLNLMNVGLDMVIIYPKHLIGLLAFFSGQRFWPLESADKICKGNKLITNVKSQILCQEKCIADGSCIGIAYPEDNNYYDDCYLCYDDDLIVHDTPYSGHTGFKRRPN